MNWYWGVALGVIVILVMSRQGERATSSRPQSDSEPATAERIDALLRSGRKIDAIKAYRKLHGVDLKAAKDAVDARARELGRLPNEP
jgi:ribosomal protein L7/L12